MDKRRHSTKHSHSFSWLVAVLCLLTLALLVYPTVTSTAQCGGPEAAWKRAREASAYHFTTDVEQTLIPRPLPSMIGQTDERVDMRIEGKVTLPDQARMEFRSVIPSTPTQSPDGQPHSPGTSAVWPHP